jgi:hypothetical protein
MRRTTLFPALSLCLALFLLTCSVSLAQSYEPNLPSAGLKAAPLKKAFVVDDRLSALRRDPDLKSQVIHRLRLGRAVFIVGAKGGGAGQPKFYRVAVTRRTRGWIHQSALAVPGRAGEDERVMKLIETSSERLDRLALCRLFIERFGHSPLLPRAMLALADEAEGAAASLTSHARKRLADAGNENTNASLRDYYLSDVGLDRYSKLHVNFDFNPSTTEYVYDGQVYREILKRFSQSREAELARKRLDLAGQKLARRQP